MEQQCLSAVLSELWHTHHPQPLLTLCVPSPALAAPGEASHGAGCPSAAWEGRAGLTKMDGAVQTSSVWGVHPVPLDGLYELCRSCAASFVGLLGLGGHRGGSRSRAEHT